MSRLAASCCVVLVLAATPARALIVDKRYHYFDIGGRTIGEIEQQLRSRGPKIAGSRQRHYGATRLEFQANPSFAPRAAGCALADLEVTLKVEIVLPRWTETAADARTHRIWAALAGIISQHEEEHASIGRQYAERLERRLKALAPAKDCASQGQRVRRALDAMLAEYDRAAARFDRREAGSLERRMQRQLDGAPAGPSNRR